MTVRAFVAIATVAISTASCSLYDGEDDPDPDVTVVQGIELAPPDMRRANGPVARYLADSEVLVFASDPLYSGSCPPTAEAEEGEEGTLKLTIDDALDDSCTADANRYTFLVQGFSDTPSRLVVEGEGAADIEIDLNRASLD